MLIVLAEASLRAAAMVAVTAVILWLFRVRDARARHAIWVCVLLLMIVSPLAVTWGPRARLPVRAPEPIVHVIGLDALWPSLSASYQSTISQPPGSRASGAIDWPSLAFGLYAVVALVLGARIAAGVLRIRRLLRTANPGRGYLTHPACVVPLVVGWRHPQIVLPVESSEWPVDRLTMVIAHEAAHAQRCDSIVQLVSLINRAIFWFHPAAWWLHRELGALAEEACDAAAIAAGHDRAEYADCLIAVAGRARGSRVHAVALGMASTALGRRVRAILAEAGPPVPPRLVGIVIPTVVLLIACLTATPAHTMATLRSARPGDGLRGFAGTFVVINDDGSFDVRYNAERADIRVSPCSTFKLPFTALFLETGIVGGPRTILKYDRRFAPEPRLSAQPASAHDQTLTSAFHESANWYFDALSRSLDQSVLERFTTRFRYGNADVRGGAERGSYWYDGQLRISANEQVRFLRRLHNGELDLAARTTALVRQIAQVEATPGWRMAAKTGACQAVDEDTTTNWYVGWVERPDDTYYFALQFAANGFDRALRERVPIARALLTQLHLLD